ncbi:MAG: Co2+/Mg2+ efflux protein ApaG, partial [Phycisphaerales bacterium]|nr:Co2+/Mg2+ efflux protein ApaG [Phycisphaerales bacterium]
RRCSSRTTAPNAPTRQAAIRGIAYCVHPMSNATAPRREYGSETVTNGIRVTVRPQYMARESSPATDQYVFAYHITIRNEGQHKAQLKSRHWVIVDAEGQRHDVHGEGVVGHTPTLAPGETFEYASYCPLTTPWGTMEGEYLMEREDGQPFSASIGRFFLVSLAEPVA